VIVIGAAYSRQDLLCCMDTKRALVGCYGKPPFVAEGL